MGDNISLGFNKVQDFFSNGMMKIQNSMAGGNYLDAAVSYEYYGVPAASFGMVIVFLGVLTYATVADKDYGVGAAAESLGDAVSSIQMPSLMAPTSSADERAEIQKEEEESAARIKELEEEEKMEKKGGKK
jgi:hypothetical protein